MGYTHYFYRDEDLDKEKFAKASADCKKVTDWLREHRGICIQFEYDDDSDPVFDNDMVRFNGDGEEGHETFVILQHLKESWRSPWREEGDTKIFAFCKTARKEYDDAVTACLIVFKHHFGDDFRVSSDGYPDEWQLGLEACQQTLGYGEVPFQKEKPS